MTDGKPLESQVQAAICDYLAAKRIFFVRLNNIPSFFIGRDGTKQFGKLGKYARVLAINGGRAIFIEVKREGGEPTKEQLELGKDAMLAGADFIIACSIDDLQRHGL